MATTKPTTETKAASKPRTRKPRTTQPKAEPKPTHHALNVPLDLWVIMEKTGNDEYWINELKKVVNRDYVPRVRSQDRKYSK